MCRREDYPPYGGSSYAEALKHAAHLGETAGTAAASWVYDGNTPRGWFERVKRGITDGDPAIIDELPAPDLSGQWADRMSGPELFSEAAGDDAPGEWFLDICEAYETAFSEAVEHHIMTACDIHLAP